MELRDSPGEPPRLTNWRAAWRRAAPSPETVRNFGPKTGNEFATATNVVGFISIFADNSSTAR